LLDFRRRVWLIKMVEAACTAAFAVVAAYLLMFLLDRAFDTPPWLRAALFVAAFVGCLRIPAAIYRWIWRNRRLEQLAMLLARKHPAVGDQLLGIIELVRNDFEQARSRALCEAAVREVAKDAQSRDFSDAVPAPRHKSWAFAAGVPIVAAVALGMLFPAAARSAWARLLSPWGGTPRYTFAALEDLPSSLVVAHGEPFSVTATLAGDTVWHPARAEAQFEGQAPVAAALQDGHYEFDMPSQLDPGWLTIKVGDATRRIKIEPTLRPELTSLVASVTLPEYLGRPGALRRDVRGGAISLVQGSKAAFTATASRTLRSAKVDGQPRTPSGASVETPETAVKDSRKMELRWRDTFGLEGKEPFTLSINGRDDEAPSLACEDLPRQKVVLDSEVLNFKIHAQDDFGVRRVGMEWQGIDDQLLTKPAKGEMFLGAGGQDKEVLELAGTFSAKSLGIEPQPVQVRIFVEDYLPGRPRVYSPPYTFFVLTPEQHAIWVTEQLSRWHRQAIEVKDREMQLHETNKELRALAAKELDKPENRRKIEHQASAERQNGRRLTALTNVGDMLVREAMRNPEFGVGHLEKWAEMLQILKDISGNRMPSVADLLKEAAQAPSVAQQGNQPQPNTKPSPMNNQAQSVAQASQKPSKPAPMAGQVRASGIPKPGEEKPGEQKDQPVIPRIADMESSQNSPPDKLAENKSAPKKPGAQPPQRLPVTTVMGKPKDAPPQPETPAEEKMEEAVRTQRDLLAEFEKIADELNRVLANLEGSTLVKRLKAASRLQYKIGGRVSDQLGDTFGVGSQQVGGGAWKVLGEMADQEGKASHDVSLIMDDMQSYFERRRFLRFKTVLDEMRTQDVIGSLRQLGDDLKKENGVSIAQCEFWSDTLDRWAEDLVDPACNGQCEAKSKDSLPPAIILEVLQILEAEVNLREETRVAEQAKAAIKAEEHQRQAHKLFGSQKGIQSRTEKVTQQIRELPDGESQFPKEIALLTRVAEVMGEAAEILDRPETGSPAIGAETEAIELLLMSKRINPKGGGGGGASPGGGGTGKTVDSALALLGGGVNEKEVREDRGVSQATGESGPSLPEEFRAGLDEYFNRLEKGNPGR
jgi:hypothetical protein